jgi:hypothetical protein
LAVASSEPHTIVQTWVSVSLAQELKARGRAEGRSVSSLVRDAIENFADTGEEPAPGEGGGSSALAEASDAPGKGRR